MRIGLNDLKMVISVSITKNALDSAAMEENELGKSRRKGWKIFRLIYIVSIFLL